MLSEKNFMEVKKHNGEVFNTMFKRTREALKNGRSVIYDATNLSAKRRINFLKSIKDINCFKRAVLLVPRIEDIMARNRERSRHVPESVILRMLKRFEVPHKSEGWDKITVVGQCFLENGYHELLECCKIPHDNPHHQLSVYDHMKEAYDYAHEHFKECDGYFLIAGAALYHDIGKPMCKSFKNAKGQPSDVAHYYNHENVGAYLYLAYSYDLINESDLIIANLIQHHMDFFKGEKYLAKVRGRFGEEFYSLLEKVHECDVAAH